MYTVLSAILFSVIILIFLLCYIIVIVRRSNYTIIREEKLCPKCHRIVIEEKNDDYETIDENREKNLDIKKMYNEVEENQEKVKNFVDIFQIEKPRDDLENIQNNEEKTTNAFEKGLKTKVRFENNDQTVNNSLEERQNVNYGVTFTHNEADFTEYENVNFDITKKQDDVKVTTNHSENVNNDDYYDKTKYPDKAMILETKTVKTTYYNDKKPIEKRVTDIDLHNIFCKVSDSIDYVFYTSMRIHLKIYLFCFKRYSSKVELIRFYDFENTFIEYLEEKKNFINDETAPRCTFSKSSIETIKFVSNMKSLNKCIPISFVYVTPMEILSYFYEQNISKGILRQDNVIPQIYFSFVIFVLQRIEEYFEINKLKPSSLLEEIKYILQGRKKYMGEDPSMRDANLFFKYILREENLPFFEKNCKYGDFMRFIFGGMQFYVFNDFEMLFNGDIEDLSLFQLAMDSFYVLTFN
ncbi:hypothetical protein NGRA_1661 [Nosema granulosis]|uniref:Uncharacterized protein n=1 Tax=Nosema granulosis TaxID=83296 RepID=A0A9P6KZD1_9MICR|nr:hypothetical protein NGRA_1661 [Nosema granulosis]